MHHAPCTVIAYIPALHKGYLDFFKKYQEGNLYILGEAFVKEVPRMDRDIRALTPEEIKTLISALGIFAKVEILNEKHTLLLRKESHPIIMPDEDVSRNFARKYFDDRKVEFISTFLRWDKQISTKEFEIPADRIVSTMALDKELINTAFKAAASSPDWWRQVGGVIAIDGKVALSAYNKPLPSDTFNILGDPRSNFDAGQNIEISKVLHAEAALIAEAARRGIALEGASLYVTTFPCPACAKSVAASGIKKVYYSKGYSLLDAEDILKAFGIEIILVK